MLYSEFAEATGCRDTVHNYKVYKDLEIMYMNSTMSKEDIYKYGKKLVDNSLTAAEKESQKQIKQRIKDYNDQIRKNNDDIRAYTEMKKYCRETFDLEMEAFYKHLISCRKAENKDFRNRIRNGKRLLIP